MTSPFWRTQLGQCPFFDPAKRSQTAPNSCPAFSKCSRSRPLSSFRISLNIAGRFGPQPAQTAHTSGRCRSCLLLSRESQSGTDQIYRASLVVSLHSECAAHACSSALNWSPSSYAEILNLARALQAGTPNRRHHPVGPQIDRPTTGRIRL